LPEFLIFSKSIICLITGIPMIGQQKFKIGEWIERQGKLAGSGFNCQVVGCYSLSA